MSSASASASPSVGSVPWWTWTAELQAVSFGPDDPPVDIVDDNETNEE
jgi:hypothetical protein